MMTLSRLLTEAARTPLAAEPDDALLRRVVGDTDPDAFDELVRRYAGLVWRTCRVTAGDGPSAEDAFQAAFLALFRCAKSIRQAGALAGWLHRTARRAAVRARRTDRTTPPRSHPGRPSLDPLDQLTARELLAAVDEEIDRLPERYRLPLLLCGVEGLSQDEAAARLGWSTGSLKGRLERARAKLRTRLEARGLTVPAGLLGLLSATGGASAVLPDLIESTRSIAQGGTASPAVTRLVMEVAWMKGSWVGKSAAVLLLAAGGLAAAVGFEREGKRPAVAIAPVRPAAVLVAAPVTPRPVTVWGKPTIGLQAGLRSPSGKTVLAPGESLEPEVIVRNVNTEPILIEHLAWGKDQAGGFVAILGQPEERELRLGWMVNIHGRAGKALITLEPGKEMVRGRVTVIHGKSERKPDDRDVPIGLGPGKYRVAMESVGDPIFDRLQPHILNKLQPNLLGAPGGGKAGGVPFPKLGTGVLELTLADAVAIAAPEPVDAQRLANGIQAARGKAIGYLKKQQRPDGTWEGLNNNFADMEGGFTALATLALLEAGVRPDDPAVVRAVAYLAKLPPKKTYVVSLQTQVLARAGAKQHAGVIQRNADWLMEKAIRQGKELAGWSYPAGIHADGSNTHFAVFGLHAATRAGAKVDPTVWREIQEMYVRTRLPDGWGYVNAPAVVAPSQSMTVAALCGLVIAASHIKQPDDAPKGEAAKAADAGWTAFLAGKGGQPKSTGYQLLVTGELGRLNGEATFKAGEKEVEWYRAGAVKLVKEQRPDGSWMLGKGLDANELYSTARALYFLGPRGK